MHNYGERRNLLLPGWGIVDPTSLLLLWDITNVCSSEPVQTLFLLAFIGKRWCEQANGQKQDGRGKAIWWVGDRYKWNCIIWADTSPTTRWRSFNITSMLASVRFLFPWSPSVQKTCQISSRCLYKVCNLQMSTPRMQCKWICIDTL